MPGTERTRRWFRIAYADNALRRALVEHGLDLDTMTAGAGIRAMIDFMALYRPQHGETDELWCEWGPRDDVFEFAVSRRMTRHGHPDTAVTLALAYRPTPARLALSGESRVQRQGDATATAGYRAISAARPLRSRVGQSEPGAS